MNFSENSEILNEKSFWQLAEFFPAAAKFGRLELFYSTAKNGFSLRSLFRIMEGLEDEIRATLLIIKDQENQVFGAILNCPIRPSRDFYGNGECLLPCSLEFPPENKKFGGGRRGGPPTSWPTQVCFFD